MSELHDLSEVREAMLELLAEPIGFAGYDLGEDTSSMSILRGSTVIYTLAEGELAALIGFDKIIITHPDRPTRLLDAHTGEELGAVRGA